MEASEARSQVAQCTLDPHDLVAQFVARALNVERHVEWAMLGDLDLECAQVAPLDAQQLFLVVDLLV
jgi:hypothetical protein